MNSQHLANDPVLKVTAVGLSEQELENLGCIFNLSERYTLVPSDGPEQALIALVNVDDPDAILYWKSRLDRFDLITIIVAQSPGRYGPVTHMARRLLGRPCFAKQVLALLESVSPKRPSPPVAVHEPIRQARWEVLRNKFSASPVVQSLGNRLELVARPPSARNPYYL